MSEEINENSEYREKKPKKEKKKKPQRVKPQLLKGFRDYHPSEQIARERMISNVQNSFELMGFLPLQTPALELAATLLGPHYSEDSLAELFGLGPNFRKVFQTFFNAFPVQGPIFTRDEVEPFGALGTLLPSLPGRQKIQPRAKAQLANGEDFF